MDTALSRPDGMYDDIFDRLLARLLRLESVTQDPRFHPEGNALYHSLQVFMLAEGASGSPRLLAAALLHDLGKASARDDHATIGARMLDGIAQPEVCWLVHHHLDLLKHPRETRTLLEGDARLAELEQLRAWDVGGRKRHVHVVNAEFALGTLLQPGVAEGWLATTATMEHEI